MNLKRMSKIFFVFVLSLLLVGCGTSERINDKRACVQQASFMQAVL